MLVKIMLCKFCNNLESKSQCVNMIIYPILQLQKEKKMLFFFKFVSVSMFYTWDFFETLF